jgi:hypothetical protein
MNRWFPLRRRRIIRSLTGANIAVEPCDPVNALTHCTDALSDHPVLKSTHLVQYCVVQTVASDEPLSWIWSVGSSGVEANLLAHLCIIWMQASDRPLVRASDHPVLKRQSSNPYCYQPLRHRMNRCPYSWFIRRSLLKSLATEFIWWM